eukprot:GHRR01026787.1.p1 GENE.GHRR01026787.1~~GHRR01026787.1.p1  ORF type:complete len:607 (+),score=217.54 GHRR01026787.1:931-2751(+)
MAIAATLSSKKAAYIKDRLKVLDRVTNESVQVLDVLGHTLYELTNITAPIRSRATALTAAQRNIAGTKAALDELLDHLNTGRRVQPMLEAGPGRDLHAFLDGLHELEQTTSYLQQHTSLTAVSQALQHSQALFNRALEQCDSDFRSSLTTGSRACATPAAWLRGKLDVKVTDSNCDELVVHLVPPELLPKLRRMVGIMADAHYTPAQQGYTAARQKVLLQVLQESGLELPPASAVVQLAPDQLDRYITNWSLQVKALTVLLLSEKRLAAAIWPESLAPHLLSQVAAPHLTALLAAGHQVVEVRKAPDRVFALLDMHRTISGALPPLSSLLTDGASHQILADLARLQLVVASAAASLFTEYAESVARDSSKVLPLDGTIHPLTAQVLSYLKRLLGYEHAAEVLFGDCHPDSDGNEQEEGYVPADTVARDALGTGIARLLMQLLDNLEVKSRGYKNEALAALFMMNNVHYVQWSVESSPGLSLLGVAWLERHKDAVEDWGAQYHKLTWMPLIELLKVEPPSDIAKVKLMLKDTFTAFNTAIERIYTHQSGWTIPDHMLREAVKRVIKDDLLEPYQDFLRRCDAVDDQDGCCWYGHVTCAANPQHGQGC